MKNLTWFFVAAMLCIQASADDNNPCQTQLQQARGIPDLQERTKALRAVLDVQHAPACVVKLLLLRNKAHVLNAILMTGFKNATDKVQQNGASVGSGGSTNLISKNLESRVLALANEYGALTEASSGNTTTISGSVDGIPLALEANSQGLVAECPLNLISEKCIRSSTLDFLSRFSYSVALNTSKASQVSGTAAGAVQGNAQPATFKSTGTPANVSQIIGKFVIIQPKVSFDKLTSALKTLESGSPLQTSGDTLSNAAKALRAFQENAGQKPGGNWANWVSGAAGHLAQTPPQQLITEWEKLGDGLATVLENGGASKGGPTDDELTQAALSYAAAFTAFGSAERSFFESTQLKNPILSFEYDNNRPPNQPTNSVFRLIYSQAAGGWTLTGNGAISIYDSDPSRAIPGAQRLRDIQFGFEADHDLPKLGMLATPTFSTAYYLQNQTSPAILNVNPSNPVPGITFTGLAPNATQVFTQKGTINIGQIKITLGKGSAGPKIPLAITFANRTELINKSDVRGQVGISYDFDALFSK